MAIEFRCNRCGRLLQTGDETAGRMAQCPDCGSQTPIPFPDDEAAVKSVEVEVLEPTAAGENPYRSPNFYGSTTVELEASAKSALISFILGLSSLFFSVFCCVCAPVGLVVSAAGLIFGLFGLRSKSRNGFAVAGIVLSSIGFLISFIVFLAFGFHRQGIRIP
jgi:hypothetical protein